MRQARLCTGQVVGIVEATPWTVALRLDVATKLKTPVYSTGPCRAALGVALAAVKPSHTIYCRIDRLAVSNNHADH